MTLRKAGAVGPGARVAIGLIRFYQYCLSPLTGPCCRHLPTCADYAGEAIQKHGLWRGCRLAAGRLARCHPWGTSGYDPVPD